MAMSFEEAMELLSGMFATLPRPVLSMVLESHSGNMERTVDYLIGLTPQEIEALQASSQNLQRLAQLDAQHGSAPSIAPPTVGLDSDEDEEALDAELRRALEVSQREQAGRPAGAEEADFSRALEATQQALGDVPQGEADQEQADALLATMLQNQMLKQQLQEDRGFTAMLDGDSERRGAGGGRGRDAPRVPAPAPAPAASWGEMLGLWGAGDPEDAGERAEPGRPQPASTTSQEGEGLFGAIAATGAWLGESLGLVDPPATGTVRASVAGDEAVATGQPVARRRPSRPADKKDD